MEGTNERVLTENEQRLCAEAGKLLAAKLSKFRRLSSPGATIMQRQPEDFAKQWESNIWCRSMQGSDAIEYDDEVKSTLRLLTKCDKKWSEAWPVDDGSYWTGEEWFVWEMNRLNYDMLETESMASGSHLVETQANLGYVCTQSDSATEATEVMLNADAHQAGLSPEAQLRKDNRRGSRSHIRGICNLLGFVNRMPNLDVVALASSWETEIWMESLEHKDSNTSYDEDVGEALEDLDYWKTYWDSSERDPEGSRTGRQLFLDHVQQLHAHEASTARQTKVPDESNASIVPPSSHDDGQDTCSSSEIDDSDGGIDIGSDDEYEVDEPETQYIPEGISQNHGLDSQIANELWNLAGGDEEPSDDSADDTEDDEQSDQSDESDGSEIISPRSPQPCESDDEDESESAMDGVSFHPSSPVVASPVASDFAFASKPFQSSIAVPIIPSGFGPQNWTGSFDSTAPLGEDMAVNGSLSAGDDAARQTSEAQDHRNHKQIDEVAVDNGSRPTNSSTVDDNVVAAVSDDHSGRIRELIVAINACEAEWLSAKAGDCAPSAFVELAKEFDGIGAKITKERDFSSPSALSKIEALFAKWQAFVNIIKTSIGVKEYFHPDHEFRFERLV